MPQENDIMNNGDKLIYNPNRSNNDKYINFAIIFAILALLALWQTLYYSIFNCFTPGGCEMAGFYFYGYFPAFIVLLLISINLFRKHNKISKGENINGENHKKLSGSTITRIIYIGIILFLLYFIFRIFTA